MGSRMNTLHRRVRTGEKPEQQSRTHSQRFHVRLEADEITLKPVHQLIHVLLGDRRIDLEGRRNDGGRRVARERRADLGAIERETRKVSPDVVRTRVSPHRVLEPSSRDLEIVGGVSPATNVGR